MDPKLWGPGLWTYLHTAAASSGTPEARQAFLNLVGALGHTIPCVKCRAHFFENQRKIDIRSYMGSAEQLFMWTFRMHDAVNQAQGKVYPQRISYLEARAKYFDVKDDSEAVGSVNIDASLCEEICDGSTIQVTSNITSDGRLKASHPTPPVVSSNSSQTEITSDSNLNSKNSSQLKLKARIRKR